MVIVGAFNILQGYYVGTTLGTNFKFSQGSGHVDSMVFNPSTLIPCNKRVITPKVEHVHCSVYHHELWWEKSPCEYLLVCENLSFSLFEKL